MSKESTQIPASEFSGITDEDRLEMIVALSERYRQSILPYCNDMQRGAVFKLDDDGSLFPVIVLSDTHQLSIESLREEIDKKILEERVQESEKISEEQGTRNDG